MLRALVWFSLAVFACPLTAGLIGTEITGSYVSRSNPEANLFDPALGNVPTGYLNAAGTTVSIAEPAIEFGEQTDISLITANFTD